MRKFLIALVLVPAVAFSADSSAQEEKKEKKGPPPQVGSVIPPFVRDKLKLSADQERQLVSLELSMHDKLAKVLSEKQLKTFEETLQQGPPQGGKEKKGPPQGKEGPPMLLIPPFVEPKLQLSAAQTKQITELDYSARTGLAKILTAAQKKQFNELLRRGPEDMPGKGEGPGGGKQPPQGRNEPEGIPPPALLGAAVDKGPGIQWFASWESGLQEARRAARPILLVSGAPHCAGVSGMWCPGKQDMDRAFLSQAAVVDASRQFVCVRIPTYENEEEGKFLKSLFTTRSGELENSVFVVLAPDGKRVLVEANRSPRHDFADAGELAETLLRVARPFAERQQGGVRPLPLVANVRLALNVAACDNRPLVVVRAQDVETGKRTEAALAALTWSDSFIGQFVYAAARSEKDLTAVRGCESQSALLVIQPDRYGREGQVLAQVPADATRERIAQLLRDAAAAHRPVAKSFPEHIRNGRQDGVFWETVIPVSDPMERRARER